MISVCSMLYVFLDNILTLSAYHLILYILLHILYFDTFPINVLVRVSKLEPLFQLENFNLRSSIFCMIFFTQPSVFFPIK